MEQDNENRPETLARPEENDLFNLTEGTAPQGGSGEPSAPETATAYASPEEPLREPEFKVNQEDRPAVHTLNTESSSPAAPNEAAVPDKDKPQITLHANEGATLGNLLKEARTTAGYSIETVSQESHIRHDFIEALEADHADALPNYVFLRAYVRALVQFYNLDSASKARIEEQIESFQPEQDVPEKLVEDIGRGGQISETETRRIKMILIYGSIILLLLISLVVTSVVAVSVRSKRIQANKNQQVEQKFDSAQLETLIPPQLPQTQVLSVPATDSAKKTDTEKESGNKQ